MVASILTKIWRLFSVKARTRGDIHLLYVIYNVQIFFYGQFDSISIDYMYINAVHGLIECEAKHITSRIAVLLSNLRNRIIYWVEDWGEICIY